MVIKSALRCSILTSFAARWICPGRTLRNRRRRFRQWSELDRQVEIALNSDLETKAYNSVTSANNAKAGVTDYIMNGMVDCWNLFENYTYAKVISRDRCTNRYCFPKWCEMCEITGAD